MVFRLYSNLKHFWQTILVNSVDILAVKKVGIRPNTLLLVHLDAIGDYIMFRNFLAIIRQSARFKGYSITLCGNEQYRDLAESLDCEFVDDFIWLNRNKFRYSIGYRFEMVRQLSSRGYSVVLHPAYSRIYYWGDSVVRASGAPERIGVDGDTVNCLWWQKRMSDQYYSTLVVTPPGYLFEFDRLKLFFQEVLKEAILLNRPMMETLPKADGLGIDGDYAVLFPGGSVPFKLWSPLNYAFVAEHLAVAHGLKIVLAGGPADVQMAREIRLKAASSCQMVDLTGKTDLSALARLIAGARLLISNETSAVHIAVSVGCCVVCIASGHQFGRFYPYPPGSYNRIRYAYPPELMNSSENVDQLWERYFTSKGFDVDTIEPGLVVHQADLLLGSCGSGRS